MATFGFPRLPSVYHPIDIAGTLINSFQAGQQILLNTKQIQLKDQQLQLARAVQPYELENARLSIQQMETGMVQAAAQHDVRMKGYELDNQIKQMQIDEFNANQVNASKGWEERLHAAPEYQEYMARVGSKNPIVLGDALAELSLSEFAEQERANHRELDNWITQQVNGLGEFSIPQSTQAFNILVNAKEYVPMIDKESGAMSFVGSNWYDFSRQKKIADRQAAIGAVDLALMSQDEKEVYYEKRTRSIAADIRNRMVSGEKVTNQEKAILSEWEKIRENLGMPTFKQDSPVFEDQEPSGSGPSVSGMSQEQALAAEKRYRPIISDLIARYHMSTRKDMTDRERQYVRRYLQIRRQAGLSLSGTMVNTLTDLLR